MSTERRTRVIGTESTGSLPVRIYDLFMQLSILPIDGTHPETGKPFSITVGSFISLHQSGYPDVVITLSAIATQMLEARARFEAEHSDWQNMPAVEIAGDG
jgi:hypothetical protein